MVDFYRAYIGIMENSGVIWGYNIRVMWGLAFRVQFRRAQKIQISYTFKGASLNPIDRSRCSGLEASS